MYVKLFEDILKSSLWAEDSDTRIVWVTMLLMADQDGFVHATAPGIAHFARVSNDVTLRALQAFESPDPNSRTTEHDGRRVERVEGGYQILNYSYYREVRDKEHERALNRERQQRYRDRQKAEKGNGDGVTPGNATVTPDNDPSRHTDAEAVKELSDFVKEILALYKEVKPPSLDSSRSRTKQHVAKLLKRHKPDKLLQAVQNYKTECEARNVEPKFRRNVANFFGRDADWEAYAVEDWQLESDAGQTETYKGRVVR